MPADYSRWLFIVRIIGDETPTMAYARDELHAGVTTAKMTSTFVSGRVMGQRPREFLNLYDFTGRPLHINLDYVTSVTTFVIDPEEVKKDS